MKWILLLLALISLLNVIKSQEIFVRKNAKDFTFNEWQDFRRGLKVMKSRHIRNPLGYFFQANIHGWDEYNGTDMANYIADYYNWHKCTHSHYLFLVWHRMYLYFFERILRASSGNPRFALPYWGYTDVYQKELPQPFRIPADEEKNPLYIKLRCDNVNKGVPLNMEITDPFPSLKSRFFAANKSNELNVCHSFGGGRVDTPVFASDRSGLVEKLPHNYIHINVGGHNGYMSDLCLAARDPVFWLNHASSDRIWESWVRLGGQNLMESQYLNQEFKFYDESGRLGTYLVKDFLNITKLNYKYDSLLKGDRVQPTTDESPDLYFSVDETKNLTISSTKRSIILEIKQKYYSLFDNIAKGKMNENNIRFTFQTVVAGSDSRLLFQLYLNLPENTVAHENRYNYIGTIAHFEGHCVPRKNRKILGITNCFDITDNLFTIFKSEYNFNGIVPRYLNLTVIPTSCGSVYYPDDDDYIIKFQRTLLIHFYPLNTTNSTQTN